MRCGDCKHWKRTRDRRISPPTDDWDETHAAVGECALLNNDFCCGGIEEGALAGCTGGGGFETRMNFGCILFESRIGHE